MSGSGTKVWVVDSVFEHGVACRHEQQPSVEKALEVIAEIGGVGASGSLS